MNKALRILKKVVLWTFAFILLLVVTGLVYLYVLPKGPEVTEQTELSTGKGSFVMYAYENRKRKSIRVWTYKPANWKDQDKIVFVMHGGGRNADDYRDAWVELAEDNNLLIIAPEFENKFSHLTTNDYQEGNLFTFFKTKNSKSQWAYTVVENIFDHIKSVNSITNEQYDIFGHSAGGQFVHRMIMLMPESRIGTAVAANAGFYSFPDETLQFPYGLKNTEVKLQPMIKQAYNKRLVVLLGEMDNDPSLGTFRTTKLAMEQGKHRLERGSNFFRANKSLSEKNGWSFNWSIDTVKNVGHDYRKMSENSVKWINH
ncbi:hypothetical protein [uncultured Roseivirga sp.]|uniref:hypothetical protein n=1 Tax=uncultured Roseivirga sp. TaxID=543088 RepID=UPI000D7A5033|nr:hypothetical protein [uncultured Roseivirga sp.]PWL28500.1 MAG: hypothetical protein DCO95_14140 [Roseivirga sp. XM-24bin3]